MRTTVLQSTRSSGAIKHQIRIQKAPSSVPDSLNLTWISAFFPSSMSFEEVTQYQTSLFRPSIPIYCSGGGFRAPSLATPLFHENDVFLWIKIGLVERKMFPIV